MRVDPFVLHNLDTRSRPTQCPAQTSSNIGLQRPQPLRQALSNRNRFRIFRELVPHRVEVAFRPPRGTSPCQTPGCTGRPLVAGQRADNKGCSVFGVPICSYTAGTSGTCFAFTLSGPVALPRPVPHRQARIEVPRRTSASTDVRHSGGAWPRYCPGRHDDQRRLRMTHDRSNTRDIRPFRNHNSSARRFSLRTP